MQPWMDLWEASHSQLGSRASSPTLWHQHPASPARGSATAPHHAASSSPDAAGSSLTARQNLTTHSEARVGGILEAGFSSGHPQGRWAVQDAVRSSMHPGPASELSSHQEAGMHDSPGWQVAAAERQTASLGGASTPFVAPMQVLRPLLQPPMHCSAVLSVCCSQPTMLRCGVPSASLGLHPAPGLWFHQVALW